MVFELKLLVISKKVGLMSNFLLTLALSESGTG